MNLDVLTAVSPIDGRYHGKTQELASYFSEFALIKYRVRVEIEYFTALCEFQLPQLAGVSRTSLDGLRLIWQNFNEEDAAHIKDIEKVTNHDVKAVEYFLKEKVKGTSLEKRGEFIHFACTASGPSTVIIYLITLHLPTSSCTVEEVSA